MTTTLTFDWEKQKRVVDHRHHYGKLKEHGFDPLTLHALIIMRSTLPKDVTLKKTHAANAELFTEKELARQLLE